MKNTWLTHNKVCLAKGNAVALNLMFETKKDHQLFLKYWKKYLGSMATLLNYHLSPTGWTLLFKTKSKEDILSAYYELRSQSKKAKSENTLQDVTRILSEHFRIFLSQYVRRSNANHKRRGSKVMQRFSKYVLDETKDYDYLFQKITSQTRDEAQINKKYQADTTQYDINCEMKIDSIWKVGTRLYMGLEEEFREWLGVRILRPEMLSDDSILRKYLNPNTLPKIHPPPT